MSEELEAALELAAESAEMAGEEAGAGAGKRVALATTVLALLAAIGSLLAGMSANQFLLQRTTAIIDQSTVETDSLQIEVLQAKHELLHAVGGAPDADEVARVARFEAAKNKATGGLSTADTKTEHALQTHEILAFGVTLLSIAISLCGIYGVVGRRLLWHGALVVGFIGAAVVAHGVGHWLVY